MSLLLLFSGSSDIAFDAASNSGYQAATSTASWSHTCTGSSRYLLVGVSMLSLAQTVTGITYNGVALTFLGSQNSVTGAARTELWGLVAPASGTNTIAVTLSGAIAWSGNASSYTNVNQAVPTEAWNAAQATNVGAADATVTVTTVADRDFTVDILATDDAAVTVGTGQTQTGNVTGAGGSGAMSYKGPKTPADATAMYWANVGALATWTIGSIALRPLAASSGTTISPPNGVITITGKTPALVQTIQAITGQIIISGGTPSVTSTLQAVAGQIVISGNTPSITTILQAVSGQVIIG